MRKCGHCGGRLRRVHRTFAERFSYLAIYACKECNREESVPRRYRYHFGPHARCPRCGTYRVVKLKGPDRIDPLYGGFLDFLERLAGGGKLFHCRYCRIQFYDRRRMSNEPDPNASAADPQATPAKPA